MPPKTSQKVLPKLLMLHGYRQNEKSFRERTGGLRKSLRNYADFVFCEAQNLIPKQDKDQETLSPNEANLEMQEEKGWWFSSENRSYNAEEETSCALGFEQTLGHLNNLFETQGPFDGVFSFSQGACLASILCKISQQNSTNVKNKYESIKFKFGILVAGFKSGQSQHAVYYDLNSKINMPTLHIIGETDKVIPKLMSENLLEYFLNTKVFVHPGGHCVPVNADAKNSIIEFLNQI